MKFQKCAHFFLIIGLLSLCFQAYGQDRKLVQPLHEVTLKEAHVGNLEIDTRLLDSYGLLPENERDFYLEARRIFTSRITDFTDPQIVAAARKNKVALMSGPLLGNLKTDGVNISLRPSSIKRLKVKVLQTDGQKVKTYTLKPKTPGKEHRIQLTGLNTNTEYHFQVFSKRKQLAAGSFRTAPEINAKEPVRIAFSSGFHKIGVHNPNLINTIVNRKPQAMVLLGDLAVDDREDNFSMHRSDYLLRDVAKPWQKLASNLAIYAAWDDHDYLNNDLAGVPKRFTNSDRDELRELWRENWNNPPNEAAGIYFSTRIGNVELIMLDTRSYRENEKRGQYGAYLGKAQLDWLKNTLKQSTATFKVVSSGTMWSDYITPGKDSWGTWDTLGREEVFQLIETENIPGVVLISGDRHGARAFKIPRPSGFKLYEFQIAAMGGVPGPRAIAKDDSQQLFGYLGLGLKAFGELHFDFDAGQPKLNFRLIDEVGKVMEEHELSYELLKPRK